MSNEANPIARTLPSYITSAVPNPAANRAPWSKTIAPTYAGIFLWFVFWDSMSTNGLTVGGLGASLLGIVLGALICHFLFYLVPGLLGMNTGLPLYVVGTSTFGAAGGLIMPGFFMGVLQFGWLGVNAFGSSDALAKGFGAPGLYVPIVIVWTLMAAFVGLKGIQYVAKVSTYLPLIPLAVLVLGLVLFAGTAGNFTPAPDLAAAGNPSLKAILGMIAGIVGFFATAGAAGVDICMSGRDKNDVKWGGYIGIIVAIIFTAGISVIVVAGARAAGVIDPSVTNMTTALSKKLSPSVYAAVMIGLTLASFPGACFSSFIAANSFKTVMPKVNPFLSVGVGAIVSMILAIVTVDGKPVAGNLGGVFGLIGASFGPIVGAMVVDYLLAGGKWNGPRAGFNPAGWIAWALGFVVGILPNDLVHKGGLVDVPCAPVAAFIVGAVVYFICAKMGLLSATVPIPEKKQA